MRLTARFDMGWSDTTQGTRNNLDSAAEATRAGVVEANRVGTDEEFPRKYKLSRGTAIVLDLWREWTEGIGGGPAVKDLERNRGSTWCEGNERRFFNRRKCDRELLYELLCPFEIFKWSLRLDGPTVSNLELLENRDDGGTAGTLLSYLETVLHALASACYAAGYVILFVMLLKAFCSMVLGVRAAGDLLSSLKGVPFSERTAFKSELLQTATELPFPKPVKACLEELEAAIDVSPKT
ncbi:hypothetical protein R1sor_004629 [Riccia sorocarpa]|uniref:Transcription activator GCR1-like domain-containing protein n=1 Tax=Riccia sorocarpa TaxID=122646 RepID=A0ABD3HH83_9MARC